MSLLNPALDGLPRRRHAASLSQTLAWYAQHAWRVLEGLGQRRAAPELRRAAQRLAAAQPELAAELRRTAQAWSVR